MMKVIGTAGHIDHGKSTLVERLTGIDPDRLREEKRRGMTIDLGFAWVTLPSGAEVSVVDVPGHERFVRNMLAGAGGIDIALLVVAADEGVMPQTREHLAILDLLNVRAGVVALTKAELVDEEMLELVGDDIMEALAGTSLEGSLVLPVSAITGRGLDKLCSALDALVTNTASPSLSGLAYLPVDRVFTVSGFGTVVTGTLHGGPLSLGDDVEVLPANRAARVRVLQTHRRAVDRAEAGSRVAVNLAGLGRDQVRRGDTLALPKTIRSTARVDVRLRMLPDAPFALLHGSSVTIHLGAAERLAILSLLDGESIEPGESGWAQLRLRGALATVFGQRFILRLPPPVGTIAGGEVVDILPRHRRHDRPARQRLDRLYAASPGERAVAVLSDGHPRDFALVAQVAGLSPGEARLALAEAVRTGALVARGDLHISQAGWNRVVRQTATYLSEYHAGHPMGQGMPREELRSRLGVAPPDWPPTLRLLALEKAVEERGTVLAAPGWRGGSGQDMAAAERVLAELNRSPFSPPGESELLTAARAGAHLLQALTDEGKIVRVTSGLYFTRESFETMVSLTLTAIERDGQVSVSQLRDTLQTSRRYTLAFLEHLDDERITRRIGDIRVLGSRRPQCA